MSVSESTPAETVSDVVVAPTTPADPRLNGDPSILGVPTFVVGSIALGLVLVGYVPAAAVGAPIAIILFATGLGQVLAAVWAASIGQSAVAAIFGIFAGFWISYAGLVLGLVNNWYGVGTDAAVSTQGLFLISWLVLVFALMVGTMRLPVIYTVLFLLIDLALLLVLLGTVNASTMLTTAGGYVVFAFALVGIYLFLNSAIQATGGKALPLGKPVIGG